MIRLLLPLFFAVYLVGCGAPQKVPVVTGGQQEPVYKSDNAIDNGNGVYIKPQQDRSEINAARSNSKPRHETKAGVAKLLASAETYTTKKKYSSAQATLERAQRIDPKEPKVYYELSLIHLKKKQYRQAEQMCRKGLSLSHGNRPLQKKLWFAMANALNGQGQKQKAMKALQRADKLKL